MIKDGFFFQRESNWHSIEYYSSKVTLCDNTNFLLYIIALKVSLHCHEFQWTSLSSGSCVYELTREKEDIRQYNSKCLIESKISSCLNSNEWNFFMNEFRDEN